MELSSALSFSCLMILMMVGHRSVVPHQCRRARYERYLAVVELGRQGHTHLAIAERVGVGAETVARCLHAPEFLSAESGVTGDEIGPVFCRTNG